MRLCIFNLTIDLFYKQKLFFFLKVWPKSKDQLTEMKWNEIEPKNQYPAQLDPKAQQSENPKEK